MNLTDPSTLSLILLAGAAAFLLIRTRGKLARQRQQWAQEGTEACDYCKVRKTASSPGWVSDDLAQWEVEMHETTRQLSAQLDAKQSLLQSLIVESDCAAARLENALERARPTLPPGSQAESLRPMAGHERNVQHEIEAVVAESDLSSTEGEPPATDRAHRREEIYRLADYGFSTAEIARRVGSPVGEVDLILSLRDSSL